MKLKLRFVALLPFLFVLGLTACSKVEYDFKALGFADKSEMEAAFAKGYQTKLKLDEMVPKVSPAVIKPQDAEVVTTPKSEDEKQSKVATIVDDSPFAPSFDCNKVTNGVERLICSDRELSKFDVELNQIYSKFRVTAPDKEKLKLDQLIWMESSRNACSDKICMVNAYRQRITEISK